jgi:D-inositol-3-phosphate glycosyltransferase
MEVTRVAAATPLANTFTRDKRVGAFENAPTPPVEIEVGLLTGGCDKAYASGLAMALVSRGVCLDFIGSDELDSPELHRSPNLRFLNLRGNQRQAASLATKVRRVLIYYVRLIGYSYAAKPKIFHILWNNKFQIIDRTLLMLFYKLLGKKIAFTAHNVNAGKRDLNDSLLNRFTLRTQYHLADHIFVHTIKMKRELLKDFGVSERTVTVIPYGINNSVPHTDLSPAEAKQRLGIGDGERTILFFGNIVPYKGLQFLADAFRRLSVKNVAYRLIIAGRLGRGCEKYLEEVQRTIGRKVIQERVIQRIEYVPDEDTELYFKAADVQVLPYTHIFQSGVLFLGYSFGLPTVAADVGSLGEDIIEGRTGFVCKPCDPVDLAIAIEKYFESDLYKRLDERRQEIRDHANSRNSWDVVGEMTRDVYLNLSGRRLS